ncbi:GGDEF domain-containing protein [Acidipila sp. EB88]|uniref:sensor domain-containing diguanylate cyclase n=1 Tax=Acidipila sp. EB88 TaxID=2305226 RepID=UPI000F5FA780|nr:GGDEF domain-containing protein [Acidipila sp. EB88]RRA48584.1 GGDEF domain-containing protein [Acidipila sp. EB88]
MLSDDSLRRIREQWTGNSTSSQLSLVSMPRARHGEEAITATATHGLDPFQLMAEYSMDVLCRLTMDGRCIYASPSATEVLGWKPREMEEQFPGDLIHPEDAETARHQMEVANAQWEQGARGTLRVRHRDGHYVWMDVATRAMPGQTAAQPWQMLVSLRDVSALRLRAEALEALTLTDSLTGLGNRRAFDAALHREASRAFRERSLLSLLMLDVDNFKRFNDLNGHQRGDACLSMIGHAIGSAARRPGDAAFRYGGEEMAILLPSTDTSGACLIAETLRAQVETLKLRPDLSQAVDGEAEVQTPRRPLLRALRVTVSIGVATMEPRAVEAAAECNPERLVAAADRALYKAKQGGRNRVVGPLMPAIKA